MKAKRKTRAQAPQDFTFMTDSFPLQTIYFSWKAGVHLDKIASEEEVLNVIDIVKGKRSITEGTKQFRQECMELRDSFIAQRNARVAAEKKADKLYDKIGYYFDLKELMWKDIKKKCESPKTIGRASKAQRIYGRCLGQILFDVPPVPTGLWTINALLELLAGNDKKGNTDEHYMSLHANAGPDMLLDALSQDIHFEIDRFCLLIFKNIQTNRTTCEENMDLSCYHKNNRMVNPQTSYMDAGVSPLVQVGKTAKSREVWDVIFETLDSRNIDVTEAEAPFTNILTFDQAVEMCPELEDLRNHKF